jgi:hypothetical protein
MAGIKQKDPSWEVFKWWNLHLLWFLYGVSWEIWSGSDPGWSDSHVPNGLQSDRFGMEVPLLWSYLGSRIQRTTWLWCGCILYSGKVFNFTTSCNNSPWWFRFHMVLHKKQFCLVSFQFSRDFLVAVRDVAWWWLEGPRRVSKRPKLPAMMTHKAKDPVYGSTGRKLQ